MNRDRYRRLPEFNERGEWKTTKSDNEYAEAWTALGGQISALFPGYVADAFDPDVRFTKWVPSPGGGTHPADHFALSVSACRLLLESVKKIKEKS